MRPECTRDSSWGKRRPAAQPAMYPKKKMGRRKKKKQTDEKKKAPESSQRTCEYFVAGYLEKRRGICSYS